MRKSKKEGEEGGAKRVPKNHEHNEEGNDCEPAKDLCDGSNADISPDNVAGFGSKLHLEVKGAGRMQGLDGQILGSERLEGHKRL